MKQRPYRLNTKYKEKVRMELDKMLATGIIEAVEEKSVVGQSLKLCQNLCQDVSKILIMVMMKLVVVPKKKGVSKLKMRPLEKIRFGGVSTLTVLTACNDESLGNLAPFGQYLPPFGQIWCLQCTVMVYLVIGFYKKTPRPVNFALHIFLSFTVQSMSVDREVQELLNEFRERGLQNLMSNPPASVPREETPPTPNQLTQT